MTTYIIELQAEADVSGIDLRALERLAVRALEAEGVEQPAELSVSLVDDTAIRKLNRAYLHIDAPTDVLSFAQGEGEPFARPDGAPRHLGDVIVSLDTARRQAAEHSIDVQDEVAHLLVHGVLHLLGYDHAEPEEEREMFGLQDDLLAQWRSRPTAPATPATS